MPRIAGQIDLAKTEAILEATSDAIYERGLSVSMDEIARRAGVSKQTVYNHYGSKSELVRALIARRTDSITAALEVPGATERPHDALADYARALLETLQMPRGVILIRLIISSVAGEPDLAQAVFKGGLRASRARLAAFLARETAAGRLAIDDVDEAADFFAGMVVSHRQLSLLMGLPSDLTPARIERIATEAARRFLKAYRP
ncbi:TetR/AcrR family transcriptional regulator [Caulobacter sp. KR2-114]|uniref:TetR/AcrR family transcriptional regulator n=1 Tax=Caulobacter sp. KR2-114 TaxID=3400912 RepID=UPI003C10E359